MSRLFTFGCSYTRYSYATWADLIGVNYDESYNFGRGGASNTYIMNKFIEADSMFNFTSDDTVIVMLTGIGRFSYYNKDKTWVTNGDLFEYHFNTKDPVVKEFVTNMYSEDWAIYSAWVAAKTMKTILTSKNVKHKFLMGIDNRNYLRVDGCKWRHEEPINQTNKTKEIYDLLDVKETLDEWMTRQKFHRNDYIVWQNNKQQDGHPTPKMHSMFAKEHLGEYYTSKSDEFLKQVEEVFVNTSQQNQGHTYEMTFNHLNKVNNYPFF